jgi:hypothetical protein
VVYLSAGNVGRAGTVHLFFLPPPTPARTARVAARTARISLCFGQGFRSRQCKSALWHSTSGAPRRL